MSIKLNSDQGTEQEHKTVKNDGKNASAFDLPNRLDKDFGNGLSNCLDSSSGPVCDGNTSTLDGDKKSCKDGLNGKKKLSNIEKYNLTVSQEEHKKSCSKGGKRSAQSRREKSSFRETITTALGAAAPASVLDVDEMQEIGTENPSVLDVMVYRLLKKGMLEPDVDIARFMRDTKGEKPTEKLQSFIHNKDAANTQDFSGRSDADLAELADELDEDESTD